MTSRPPSSPAPAAANPPAPVGYPRTAGRGANATGHKQASNSASPSRSAKSVLSRLELLWRLPRSIRRLLQVVFGLALAVMLTLAILFILVQRGPISVGFLVGPIENAIGRELGTGSVAIEGALLRQSEDGRGIEFRLTNLRIKDGTGVILAETPLAGISLSGAALLRGRLAPVSVEFIRPRLRLTATQEGGLALAVSRPPEATGGGALPSAIVRRGPAGASSAVGGAPATAAADSPRPIDLVAAFRRTVADFRQNEAASTYLREFGVRDATLTIAHGDQETVWQIPGFAIDVQHFQKRSVIVGEGLIGSTAGPWGLSFRTTESNKFKTLQIEIEFAELVPRAIASQLAFLPGVSLIDMPVAGRASIAFALDGGLVSADLKVTPSRGHLHLPAALGGAVAVTGGALHLSYAAGERRLVVNPSELIWANSRGTFSGDLTPSRSGSEPWAVTLNSRDAVIEGLALSEAAIVGHFVPQTGHTRIERLTLRAGDAQVVLRGGTIATPNGAGFQLDGAVGPLGLPALLGLWPRQTAPALAQWVRTNVQKGRISRGTLRLAPGAASAPFKPGAAAADPPLQVGPLAGLSLDLELQDLQVTPLTGFVPVTAETARLRLDGGRLELTTGQARLPLPSGRQVALKDPRLTMSAVAGANSMAEVVLQSSGPAGTLLELLDQEPFGLLRDIGVDAQTLDGKSETTIRASFPVNPGVAIADIKVEGRIRVTDMRSKGVLGGWDISGGTLLLGLTDKALDAKGDILVAGVPARISWQRIFNAAADRQPPARLTATLDASDRDMLGLSLNHMVQGEVPVVLTLQQDGQGQTTAQIEANLGSAELLIETMAWRKAPGRPAVLQSNIARTKDGHIELQNFKIIGDDISLDGSVTLDARNKLRAFNFPAFAVNVLTKLEMQGRMRDDGVLEVKTKGTAYDGRPFFRSLFSAGQVTERALPTPRHRQGLDLSVEIDTIVGFNETNLRNVSFQLKRRGDKTIALQAVGQLSDTGHPVNAEIRVQNGIRMLHANSTDAGSAFRLIGLYPNMRGGNGALDVNLDGRGPAERTGRLRTSQFAVLGDPEVSELQVGPDNVRKVARTKVVREQVNFEHLEVPFSIGHGQVVLGDSTINGPLVGARLNGKIDYNNQTVFLEGTYVPVYGLNSIPNNLPIIGDILSGGRSGDGLFALSFQVQGPMGRPQILINPLSVLTPGPFRQIWETAPQGHAVIPRAEPKARGPAAQSSSAEPQTGESPAKAAAGRASSSGPQRVEPASLPGAASRPDSPQRPPPGERPPAARQQVDGQ